MKRALLFILMYCASSNAFSGERRFEQLDNHRGAFYLGLFTGISGHGPSYFIKDSAKFVLYEAYSSGDDSAAHKQTSHYLKWRETVADWMAKPREGVLYKALLPDNL